MRIKTKLAVTCIFAGALAGSSFAQGEAAKGSAEPAKYYHLDFTVRELEAGKVTNSRNYSTTISSGDTGTSVIRTGSKLPVSTGSGTEPTTFTYVDVGVNIDSRWAKEIQGDLALNISAEISSAATTSRQPLIRQTKWSANVLVPLRKPTVVFSGDDPTTKGQTQLELTVTPVK